MDGQAAKRVTAADVARSLGISRATVGFVLNDTPGQTISEQTRQRVVAEAERLGYRPHRAAQDLRRGSSRVILAVLPSWPMEFRMREYLEEAALVLDEAGYSLAIYARPAVGHARPMWELLNPEVVMGLGPFGDSELASMRACGITKIIPDFGRPVRLDELAPFTAGADLQVRHLWDLGHRKLGFASSPEPRLSPIVEAQLRVAQRTAGQLGLGPLDARAIDYQDGSAAAAVRGWRGAAVTGVVAWNDDAAATVVSAAVRAGVSVPAELSVIGHDDIPLATTFLPSISTVRFDAVGLGHQVAALALHVADGRPLPRQDWDPAATVIARESTAAVGRACQAGG